MKKRKKLRNTVTKEKGNEEKTSLFVAKQRKKEGCEKGKERKEGEV